MNSIVELDCGEVSTVSGGSLGFVVAGVAGYLVYSGLNGKQSELIDVMIGFLKEKKTKSPVIIAVASYQFSAAVLAVTVAVAGYGVGSMTGEFLSWAKKKIFG